MSLNFNQLDIEERVDQIFMDQTRIEVAFDLDSVLPIVLPTNICRYNYESNRRLIYQPHPEILPSYQYDTMDISTLIENELNQMARVGLKCRIAKFLNNYKVSDRTAENCILIDYFPPMRKVNLRTTYRLRTGYHFNVEGRLLYQDDLYESGRHFTVQDISVTGAGLLIPKQVGKKENSLLNVPLNASFDIELTLTQAAAGKPPQKISTPVEMARKVMTLNAANGFIGIRFADLNAEDQENLFQFIHDAQLFEIRNIKHL